MASTDPPPHGNHVNEPAKTDSEGPKINECFICRKTYNRTSRAPVSMPCGHTFCRSCIRYKTKQNNTFTCGVCSEISLTGLNDFKKNEDLIKMFERDNLLASDDDFDVEETLIPSITTVLGDTGEGFVSNEPEDNCADEESQNDPWEVDSSLSINSSEASLMQARALIAELERARAQIEREMEVLEFKAEILKEKNAALELQLKQTSSTHNP